MNVQVIDPFHAAKDPQMPLLAVALDPVAVEGVFARRLSALADGNGPLRLRAIRVTRYKPGRRCLLEYHLESTRASAAGGELVLIGKTRAKKLKRSTYDYQKALYDNGFGEDAPDGISVPQPVAIIPEFQMWLQRKVPGISAPRLLAEPGGVALARRIAEAVAKLHRAGVPASRRHTMADELGILHQRLPRVAELKPRWARRIEEILRACDRLGAAVRLPQWRSIHRDFYPDQVVVAGPRLYLVDFDLYCQGDPGLDIGNFIGHIIEQSIRTKGRPDRLKDCQEAFRIRFAELAGQDACASAEAYTTLTLVRHCYLSTQLRGRQAYTEELLRLCEKRLGASRRRKRIPAGL